MLGHQRSNIPHHARFVFIIHDEKHALGHALHIAAVETHDAGLAAKKRTARGNLGVACVRLEMHPLGVIRPLVRFHFFHLNAQRTGQRANVDLVDLRAADLFKKALEHAARHGISRHFGCFAAVSDLHVIVALGGELGDEAAQFFAQ